MPIPNFQKLMLPLLKFAGDDNPHTVTEAEDHLAAVFGLPESEIREMLKLWHDSGLPTKPKGRDTVENLTKQVQAYPDLFIGSFDGDEMVAVIVGSDDGRKGWINRLAVLSEPGKIRKKEHA